MKNNNAKPSETDPFLASVHKLKAALSGFESVLRVLLVTTPSSNAPVKPKLEKKRRERPRKATTGGTCSNAD